MLGGDDDQGRIVDLRLLEFGDHQADRVVDKLDLLEQRIAGGPDRIERAASGAVAFGHRAMLVDEPLADADRLEVHSKDCGDRYAPAAVVVFALNFGEDRLDLKALVTLDILEAPGVVIVRVFGGVVRQRTASEDLYRRRLGLKVGGIGIDFRRIEVVNVGSVAGPRDRDIRRMFVGPGGAHTSFVDEAENRIGADKVIRKDWFTAIFGIALELVRIDRISLAIGSTAVEVGLVDVDGLFVFVT